MATGRDAVGARGARKKAKIVREEACDLDRKAADQALMKDLGHGK
jgi:hypothetical protein